MKLSNLFSIIFTIYFALLHSGTQAQTFLGKRFSIDAGSTVHPNLLTPILGNENYFSLWSVFPSSLDLGIGYTPFSRLNLRLECGTYKPQIAGIRFFEEFSFDTINQQFVDSFYLSSNVKYLNFSFRIYQDYAPIGRYFTLFGGLNFVETRITPSTAYWNITPTTSYYENNRLSSILIRNNAFRVGIGYGRTQLITRKLYLDFGFRTSLTFADRLLTDEEFNSIIEIVETPVYKEGYALEYTDNNSKKFSNGIRKNLLNTYFFEVYFNFGLSF